MTLSWKDVPLIRENDHITYIVVGSENENRDLEQVPVLLNFIGNNLSLCGNIQCSYLHEAFNISA